MRRFDFLASQASDRLHNRAEAAEGVRRGLVLHDTPIAIQVRTAAVDQVLGQAGVQVKCGPRPRLHQPSGSGSRGALRMRSRPRMTNRLPGRTCISWHRRSEGLP
jgi:hypothetical protein